MGVTVPHLLSSPPAGTMKHTWLATEHTFSLGHSGIGINEMVNIEITYSGSDIG